MHPHRAWGILAAIALTATACTGTTVAERASPSQAPAVAPSSTATSGSPPPRVAPTPTEPPRFRSSIARVDRSLVGWSWRPGCPVPLERLRLVRLRYWDFDGRVRDGRMIVHERWARPIANVFGRLFEARFPLERMALANEFQPNDPTRAAANLTTGFVCRPSVADPGRWSEHAYGRAVDINPLQNPYISRAGGVIPTPWGAPFVDRSKDHPGMIHRDGVVVRAFRAIGWRWGGAFERSKDYHHFSATGR